VLAAVKDRPRLGEAPQDVTGGVVTVRRAFVEVRKQGVVAAPPKSRASARSVRLPASVVQDLAAHMESWSGEGPDGLVFTIPSGRPVRRGNFNKDVSWRSTVTAMGRPGLHFHDLRHTGNTLAAVAGVSTRDLMARMGHDSLQAALVYQHATQSVDERIAPSLEDQMAAVRARKLAE
jgi:integrase